jgi:acyl-CoA thioester hydrolase
MRVEDRPLVHLMRMPIRWGDMDMMGHVNNAMYFTYLETARIDWFTKIGCSPNPAGEGPVLINAACTFIRQLEYPGDIEVRTFIGDFGRTSFETYHQIRRVDQPDIVCAEGSAKVVWVDFVAGKSTPLSDELKARFAAPMPD